MPANMTLRDVPDDLQQWLKSQAQEHRRSLNREVLVLLESIRAAGGQAPTKVNYEELRNISMRAATLPLRDTRREADILGLDETGLPT